MSTTEVDPGHHPRGVLGVQPDASVGSCRRGGGGGAALRGHVQPGLHSQLGVHGQHTASL